MKNQSTELYKKAAGLYAEVERLAGTDATAEAIQAVMDEAKAAQDKADIVKKAEEAKAALAAPVLPADLPTGGDLPADQPAPTPEAKAFDAAYTLRYKTEGEEVNAILQDVYGTSYRQQRYEKNAAFENYLRRGEGANTGVAKSFVMTPADALDLIQQGKSVASFKATMVESVGSLGGFVVPGDFSSNIVQRLPGLTVMRGRAAVESTSRDSMTLAKDRGGDTQYTSNIRETFVNETPTGTTSETNLLWSMEEVPVHTAMASVPISKNLLEDAAFDLVGHLTRKLSEAAAINEDNRFLTGDGVGKPQGILPGGANGNGLAEVVTGSSSALTFNGLIKMTFGIASQYLPGAVWIANRATYQAIALLRDESGGAGTGQYLWRDQYGNNVSGPQRMLLGYPVLMQETMPSVGANTYPILFGNPQGYTIIDRIGMTVDRYDDATTAKKNMVEFVMRRRFGGQLLESYRFCVQKVST